MSDGEAPEYKEGDRRTSQDRVSAVRARAGVHRPQGALARPGREASAGALSSQTHMAACLDPDCRSGARQERPAGNLRIASPGPAA
jgi:hypothetical protein